MCHLDSSVTLVTMARSLLSFATVLAVALTLGSSALATTTTKLSLPSYADMVVDDAHNHVFVSGGSGTSSLVVLTFSGTVAGTITSEPGAAGMAVDEANSLLYVALTDANAIAVIDTTTLAEVDRFPLAPASAPRELALAGGRIWFTRDCSGSTGFLGSLALDGSDLQLYDTTGDLPHRCGRLAPSPADPNTLVVSEVGVSPPTSYVYDVSTNVPSATVTGGMVGSDDFEDMVLTPDGATLLAAAGAPYSIQAFALADLAAGDTYPTGAYPAAVAVTDDGAYVAAGIASASEDEILVFPAGETTALRGYDFGASGTDIYAAGLAFNAAATKLFSVAYPTATSGIVFRAHGSPTEAPRATTASLSTSREKVNYGRAVTLTAHVSGSRSGKMRIYATPYGGSAKLIASGTVNSKGNLTKKWTPKAKTTFRAEYAGDDRHEASASGGRVVKVRARTSVSLGGAYGRSGKYKLYHRGTNPRINGKVVPNHAGFSLKFIAQRYSGGRWVTEASGTYTIDFDGVSRAILYNVYPGYLYRVRVVFGGDADHLGSGSAWAYLRVT
jgi:hypothetical protein